MPSDDIVTRLLRPLNVLAFNDLTEEAAEEINRLRELVSKTDKLTAERDEARRMYCRAVEEIERGLSNDSRRDVAKARGWDCYDNYTEEEVTDDGNAEF